MFSNGTHISMNCIYPSPYWNSWITCSPKKSWLWRQWQWQQWQMLQLPSSSVPPVSQPWMSNVKYIREKQWTCSNYCYRSGEAHRELSVFLLDSCRGERDKSHWQAQHPGIVCGNMLLLPATHSASNVREGPLGVNMWVTKIQSSALRLPKTVGNQFSKCDKMPPPLCNPILYNCAPLHPLYGFAFCCLTSTFLWEWTSTIWISIREVREKDIFLQRCPPLSLLWGIPSAEGFARPCAWPWRCVSSPQPSPCQLAPNRKGHLLLWRAAWWLLLVSSHSFPSVCCFYMCI